MTNSLKKSFTNIVSAGVDAKVAKKSTGTKIASSQRLIPIKIIQPFSL